MLKSHSFHKLDFQTSWYKRWAKELRQDADHLEDYALHANKFWQNAVMAQLLNEHGMLQAGKHAVGFGVGRERLPALFAKYGVNVTATDQDFRTQKAGHWAEHELASGAQSLNTLGICEQEKFVEQVEYLSVDMTKIPRKLHAKYDFLWSNCALGHLGSIPAGLAFIERSLECLKPGGWAVHTTELNILSNNQTVTEGDTVIFRLQDIYKLQQHLVRMGYTVLPFHLTLGKLPEDREIGLAPKFGNDYSKIQFKEHLATQIVLAIHKPEGFGTRPPAKRRQLLELAKLGRSYYSNLAALKRYKKTDKTIVQMRRSKQAGTDKIKLRPLKSEINVVVAQGKAATQRVAYRNTSSISVFAVSTKLGAGHIVLATPDNANSPFAAKGWLSPNRPAAHMWFESKDGEIISNDYAQPGQDFFYEVTMDARKHKKGSYVQEFCVVQEGLGWVAESTVKINLTIT